MVAKVRNGYEPRVRRVRKSGSTIKRQDLIDYIAKAAEILDRSPIYLATKGAHAGLWDMLHSGSRVWPETEQKLRAYIDGRLAEHLLSQTGNGVGR